MTWHQRSTVGLICFLSALPLVGLLIGCRGNDGASPQTEGGISSGGILAIFVPVEKGLLVQSYWYQGEPYYLLYNNKTEPLEFSVDGAKSRSDSPVSSNLTVESIARLAGPWVLAPATFRIVPIASFPTPNPMPPSYLFWFRPDLGLMLPPDAARAGRLDSASYSFNESINGLGGAWHAQVWFEFSTMSVSAGAATNAVLKVTGEFSWMCLSRGESADLNVVPDMIVESASSANLRRAEVGQDICFYRDGLSPNTVYSISVVVRAPAVVNTTLAEVKSFGCTREENGQCSQSLRLSPGILVVP